MFASPAQVVGRWCTFKDAVRGSCEVLHWSELSGKRRQRPVECGNQTAHQSLITDVLQFRLHPCAIIMRGPFVRAVASSCPEHRQRTSDAVIAPVTRRRNLSLGSALSRNTLIQEVLFPAAASTIPARSVQFSLLKRQVCDGMRLGT